MRIPNDRHPSHSPRRNGKARNRVATTEPRAVEQRIRLTGVDWETFDKLAATARGGRFAFDRGALEILSPGPLHQQHAGHLGEFVRIVTRSLRIPRMSLGSTTWKRQEAERGIEADECFYFTPAKIAAANAALARGSNDSNDYPVPDLAVEVDLSAPQSIGRRSMRRSAWPKSGGSPTARPGSNISARTGPTNARAASRFLPVRDSDIQRWLIDEDLSDEAAWEERVEAWRGGWASRGRRDGLVARRGI